MNKAENTPIEAAKLLAIYKATVTKISKLRLRNIDVNITFAFSSDVSDDDFRITVFDKGGDNGTFYFYGWKTEDKMKCLVDGAMATIKQDDFSKVTSYLEGIAP